MRVAPLEQHVWFLGARTSLALPATELPVPPMSAQESKHVTYHTSLCLDYQRRVGWEGKEE